MVCSFPVSFVLVVFEEREVDDPAEGEAWLDEIKVRSQLTADCIHAVAALLPVVQGDHKDHVTALGSCLLQNYLLVSGKIL